MIEHATGQSIKINSVEPGEAVPGLPPFVSELWVLFVQLGNLDLDTSDIAQEYGIDLIGVEDFILRTFGISS